MSWSLQIEGGDFQVSTARLGTVIGHKKLVQDLTCAIMEHMGTDNLHPSYGSLIDGGITPDGTPISSIIGDSDIETVVLRIETEITRLAQQQQQTQLARAKADKLTYGQATLDASEVLIDISGINYIQNNDKLNVKVTLTTAEGGNIDFVVALEATS